MGTVINGVCGLYSPKKTLTNKWRVPRVEAVSLRNKARIHTATRIPDRKREAIVLALAGGESKRSTSRRLKTSEHIVDIVEREDWQRVAERKVRLAAQAERNAYLAGDQLTEALQDKKNKIPANVLVPIYGVSIDKALAIRGDPSLIIRHEHDHRHLHVDMSKDFNAFLSELPASSHEAKTLPVIDVEETVSRSPKEQGNSLIQEREDITHLVLSVTPASPREPSKTYRE